MVPQLTSGTIFAGRYRIERWLGRGGMGAVYEVVHLDTERRRALKVMHPHILQSEGLRERFLREAKVAAHVESEHIVDVCDAGVDQLTGSPYLVMELLRGEELGKRVKRLGKLPIDETLTYLHQAAIALDKTHRASIVHRDIKPANLFLTKSENGQPRIKVLDFGVAKLVAESAAEGATAEVGTPLYMAPEQFNPNARLTGAADVYALGMVAYTLLTGRAYWADEAKQAGVYALAALALLGPQEAPSARAAARGVRLPPLFDSWFLRITALDPAKRYGSATEAVRALAAALASDRAATAAAPWDTTTSFGIEHTRPGSVPSRPPLSLPRSGDGRGPVGIAEAATRLGETPVFEPTQRSRKRAVVGALGFLALGLALGLGWRTQRAPVPVASAADVPPQRAAAAAAAPPDDAEPSAPAASPATAASAAPSATALATSTRAPSSHAPSVSTIASAPQRPAKAPARPKVQPPAADWQTQFSRE